MLNFVRKMSTVPPARILSQKSFQVPGKLKVTEHFFQVPTDYTKPEAGQLKIFGRSVRKHEIPIVPKHDPEKDQLPWMVFLNGGPGQACRPPQDYAFTQTVLDKGYQLFFLDQRGTGLSTPITASTLKMRGSIAEQADHLQHYHTDSIVRDCEAIRQALTEDWPEDKRRWSTMGQSFGGFITLTYLSFFPEGLRECFTFGGLQPLVKDPDEVYRRLYKKVTERNQAYYQKFPEDVARVRAIMQYLTQTSNGKLEIPSGGFLTPRRFQQLGILFGMHSGLDIVHNIVLKASYDLETFKHITRSTLCTIDATQGFDTALIYSILHEPIYCVGAAANWSAHRIRDESPQFTSTVSPEPTKPIYFTGEMIYPWMFEDYADLDQVRDVAELIAAKKDWPELFDVEQLQRNTVPVYAASYIEDMYVDVGFGLETARTIKGCKVFNTNTLYHNAIGAKMDEVFGKAFQLREDTID